MERKAPRFLGQEVGEAEQALIREIVGTCGGLSRMELAATVGELLGWKRRRGSLKARECREFLEKLESQGGGWCCPPSGGGGRRGKATEVPVTAGGEPGARLVGTARDLGEIRLQQGRELLRRLYQAHLERRAPGEATAAVRDAQGQVRQQSRRQERGLETVFGEVRVERLGYGGEGLQSLHPLDADLNLPPELYSHQVRRRVAEEAAEFDKVVEALSKTTGAQVGKRQVEELVGRAAQDFDAFYQERQAGALQESESGPILAISVDGKGVVLRGEDLREATRQRAEASEHKRQKRLSKGEKRHAKRMATVAAVYSLEKRPEEVIEQALGEARSRDPTGRKSWVVLVDGHRSQLKTLVRCLRRSPAGLHPRSCWTSST